MRHPTPIEPSRVVELRQYTLRPGARQTLVDLFERELIEPQEAVGMQVGGLFLDRDDPDRFVWFRGFPDMSARQRSLERFYFGPVWREFRDEANATMLDSDDVLLLRPTQPARHAPAPSAGRAEVGVRGPSDEWVTIAVYAHPADDELSRWMTEDLQAAVQQHLRVPVATYRSEPSKNTFPALPVRQDNVFVWMAAFADEDEYEAGRQRLVGSAVWQNDISPRLEAEVTGRECLRLRPTGRSLHPSAG